MHNNYTRKKFLGKPNSLRNKTCLGPKQGVYQKEKTKGYINMNLNVEYVWMILKVTEKFNFPGVPPTWNASTW